MRVEGAKRVPGGSMGLSQKKGDLSRQHGSNRGGGKNAQQITPKHAFLSLPHGRPGPEWL